MKKKFFSATIAAALCACAISTRAFAADITVDRSIYASNLESISRLAKNRELFGDYIVDLNTVMPAYYIDIYDYAKTGNLNIKPFSEDGEVGQKYISNALNENGEPIGILTFAIDGSDPGFQVFSSYTNKAESVSFALNAKRVSAVMSKQNISSDCKEVKLVYISDVGYVYYIDNGISKYLAAANIYGVSGELFNDGNGGIVEINDDFKAFADRKLAELEEYQKFLETLAPGENPPSNGYETPMFKVDNTPYLDASADNPNTGGTSSALAGIALTACVIGVSAAKKKKKQ